MENADFIQIYNILQASFEPCLYRSFDAQKKLLLNDKYKIITYKENSNIYGFLSYWEIDENVLFVEHFAVDKAMRGRGIGSLLFKDFLKLPGIKILEVEPPHTDIDKKRINLYKSFGLKFIDKEYYQPPYNKGDDKVKLFLMCSQTLQDDLFNDLVQKIHKTVYNYE